MDSSIPHEDIAAIGRISSIPTILEAVSQLTGMRLSLVARVTPHSWTACAVRDRMDFGLSVGDQLEIATTLCKEVHDSRKPIVIESAKKDPNYTSHHTPKLYNIESYIAIPILQPDGDVFGTLCAVDNRPAELGPKVVNALTLFADLIWRQLEAEKQQEAVELQLRTERALSQLREQFIAALGHDLRTPLSAVLSGAHALSAIVPDEDARQLVDLIQRSSTDMQGMIDDLLDFARGRLGDGIPIEDRRSTDLREIAQRAIDQLAQVHRDREVRFEANGAVLAAVDSGRIRQLMANLIGNALQHSPADEPISVSLSATDGIARLKVSNGGPPIPEPVRRDLFKPFCPPAHQRSRKGLGLGLFIASEIARAHGGSLHLDSDTTRTTFTLVLPSASGRD